MKTIFIVRHAKAESFAEIDKERQLLPLGIERANKLGEYLETNQCKPDVLFASPADRTTATAKIIASHVNYPEDEICCQEDLYLAGHEQYFKYIVAQNEDTQSIMFVGHNPDVSNLVHFFLPDFIEYMRTGECYCIDFETNSWQEIFTAEKKKRFSVHFR